MCLQLWKYTESLLNLIPKWLPVWKCTGVLIQKPMAECHSLISMLIFSLFDVYIHSLVLNSHDFLIQFLYFHVLKCTSGYVKYHKCVNNILWSGMVLLKCRCCVEVQYLVVKSCVDCPLMCCSCVECYVFLHVKCQAHALIVHSSCVAHVLSVIMYMWRLMY